MRVSPLSKILLPMVFSQRCRGAARYAEALARHFQAELVLLHVVTPPYSLYAGAGEASAYCDSSAADLVAERLAQSRTELDIFLADAPRDLRVRGVVLEGDPACKIVEYAHAEKFDLIVMPTHGYGPFRRFLLGSVTAKVLHDAECPVWTGPHMEEAPAWESITLRKVACALDLGPQSRVVLAWGGGIAQEFCANLAVLHAIPAATVGLGSYYFDPHWRLQLEKAAQEQIAHLEENLQMHGEVHIEFGDVPTAVSNAARYLQVDLLVIGRSHGAGVFGRLQANAYAILRESSCPVVSI
jgi:nucleotide-binding universal stress UspA family protein